MGDTRLDREPTSTVKIGSKHVLKTYSAFFSWSKEFQFHAFRCFMIHILLHIIYIFCFVVIRFSCKSEDSPIIVVVTVRLIVVVQVHVVTVEVHDHGVVRIIL